MMTSRRFDSQFILAFSFGANFVNYVQIKEMEYVLNFSEILKSRRSIRRYKSQAIPRETILELLDVCRNAANAHNAQPFRFVLLLNISTRKELLDAMGIQYAKDLKEDGISELKIRNFVQNSIDTFLNAPILVLACLSMEDMHKYPDPERQQYEYIMGIQSVSSALQNLLLLAHSKGIGACWYCAPLFCPDIVKSILNLPNSYNPQAFITLGIANESPTPPSSKTP